MFDPIVQFFIRIFQAIGRAIGFVVSLVLRPFVWLGRWYRERGWMLRAVVGAILLCIVAGFAYFFWNTQRWTNFNPDYPASLDLSPLGGTAGQPAAPAGGIVTTDKAAQPAAPAQAPQTCRRSVIVDVTRDLVDFNVNQNAWISSMLLYKLGLFGIDWDRTFFFDNKAALQRGVHQAVRRTSIELVDTLRRVRGTSQIDASLQNARGNLQFNEYTWYFGWRPFGPKTPTPSFYRTAITDLNDFNTRLEKCDAVFDARADNLLQFVDRIANDIGATSAILRERLENYNLGWFDPRADDHFWFAYGQLYGYYGTLTAARADFKEVIAQRGLGQLWVELENQLRAALNIRPFIISNGSESGLFMPLHLATMGFYVLRVRSNLVEIRLVLDR
ncbi:DUF2333 family protein [Methyloceanibacter sp.]|jgi:hypothetical protein|uniref:DUF2333 family protein n=1 Tax=Methyloceanibacter sp. TaxID=1965321 RepID=UPI00351BBAC0